MPHIDATKRQRAETRRTGRRPYTLANGTQMVLPRPMKRMLAWMWSVKTWDHRFRNQEKYRDKKHELVERLRVRWERQIPDGKGWPNACRREVGREGVETEGGQAQVFSPQRPVQGVGRVGAGYRIVRDMFGVFPISSCVALLLDVNNVSWRASGVNIKCCCPTHDTCRSGRSGRSDGIARQPKGVFPARHIG